MSALSQFNDAVRRSQEQRSDVRVIIQHVSSRTHTCSLIATGYCRICPAYIAHRNGVYSIITSTSIGFNYEAEYLRATQMSRLMMRPHSHLNWVGLPPIVRTKIGDIRPPIEMSNHVCAQCTREHLSDHHCAICSREHLDEHVCPTVPEGLPAPFEPVTSTETATSSGRPDISPALWTALQDIIRRAETAPQGTQLNSLTRVMNRERVNAATLIQRLETRQVTTTVTKTVPTSTPPPTEIPLPQSCDLIHIDDLPPSVSNTYDPTIVSIHLMNHFLTYEEDVLLEHSNSLSLDAIGRVCRTLDRNEINITIHQASYNMLNFIRWNVALHASHEHNDFTAPANCRFWPCIFNLMRDCFDNARVNPSRRIHCAQFLRWALNSTGFAIPSNPLSSSNQYRFIQPVLIERDPVTLPTYSPERMIRPSFLEPSRGTHEYHTFPEVNDKGHIEHISSLETFEL